MSFETQNQSFKVNLSKNDLSAQEKQAAQYRQQIKMASKHIRQHQYLKCVNTLQTSVQSKEVRWMTQIKMLRRLCIAQNKIISKDLQKQDM